MKQRWWRVSWLAASCVAGIACSMAGTINVPVILSLPISCHDSLGPKLFRITSAAPLQMQGSSSSKPAGSGSASAAASRQGSQLRAKGRLAAPSCTHSRRSVLLTRRCSSAASAAKLSSNTSTVAPASFRMNSSSSATGRQFSGTLMAPILATAKKLSTNSAPFIINSATRSPGFTPSASSALATWLLRALSWR